MTMCKEDKLEIDRLVCIYLNGIQSVTNDAGWQMVGIMGKLIDFAGDLPPPSGNDQSNLSMILAIKLLRQRHAEWPTIYPAMTMFKRDKAEQALALLSKNFYVGLNKETDKPFTDQERADAIGQDQRVYRYNLEKGYYSLKAELERAENYKSLFQDAS